MQGGSSSSTYGGIAGRALVHDLLRSTCGSLSLTQLSMAAAAMHNPDTTDDVGAA